LNQPAYSRARATSSFGDTLVRQQSPFKAVDFFLSAM
jgi:hypothetical protein